MYKSERLSLSLSLFLSFSFFSFFERGFSVNTHANLLFLGLQIIGICTMLQKSSEHCRSTRRSAFLSSPSTCWYVPSLATVRLSRLSSWHHRLILLRPNN